MPLHSPETYRFRQALANERDILRRWVALHVNDYDRLAENVLVGQGYDPGPTWPDNYRAMQLHLSRRRIDAVAWKGLQPTIIEAKDRIGTGALGQVLTYRNLWIAANPGGPAPILLIVATAIGPDIAPSLAEHSVAFELI